MRKLCLLAGLAALLLAGAPAMGDDGLQAPDTDGKWEDGKLKFKVLPKTQLACSKPMAVGMKIELPSPSGGFATKADGGDVQVDLTGDGNLNTKAKEGRPVFLKLTYDTGETAKYALRFYRGARRAWYYEPASGMYGMVAREKITLIDANCNGEYGDFGQDAILIGRDKWAAPLSRVVNLKGKLYHLKVGARGETVSVQEYGGPTGKLDLRKNFRAPGGLTYAIVQSGEVYFNLTDRGGADVPTGKYVVIAGHLEKGRKSCDIVKGEMKEMEVGSGAKVEPDWGPPMRIEFKASLNKDKLHIDARLRVFGAAGEEYVNFKTAIMTPEITVRSSEGIEACTGRFATG